MQPPLLDPGRAEPVIEAERKLVPVERGPLEPRAPPLDREVREMRQKHSANARPAMLGRDVQVLEPDARAALPRGDGRVEHRKASRPTLELRDQRLRRSARSKQRLGE